MSRVENTTPESPELLTFGEAARLSGQPKAYLKELAESGRIAVRMVNGEGESKLRLTRGALAEAGLFPQHPALDQPERTELADLIALVREQTFRITALEEQRFHLGAQLGVAVERVANLEDQVSALTGSFPVPDEESWAITTETAPAPPTSRHVLIEIGEVGKRKSAEVRERLFSGRLRMPFRSQNSRDSGWGE